MENHIEKIKAESFLKNKEIIGRNLRFLRKSLGLKIVDFSSKLGISTHQLGRLENAEAYGIALSAIYFIGKHASLEKFFKEDIEFKVRQMTKDILLKDSI